MAEGRILRQLIQAGARGDDAAFREAAAEVIRDERAKKHHLLANDLELILYGERTGRMAPARPLTLPRDTERGVDLLTIKQPVRTLEDLVVSKETNDVLDAVLVEQNRSDLLGSFGLKPTGRLLFFGPPGCGKTSAAEVLATEVGAELVTVRFDAVVSSFLGETSANLRKVFDFISTGRFVVLFDEFDAIAKEREDPAEHGELRRVVNSFLQLLDSYRGQSIVIAATNHEGLIDRALWRRFDEVIEFGPPSQADLVRLLTAKLRGVRHELDLSSHEWLSQFQSMSHADVERVLIRAIKAMILKGREFLTSDLVEASIRRETSRKHLVLTRAALSRGNRSRGRKTRTP